MILDTSAILTIVFGETGNEAFVDAIATAPSCRISAASLLEVSIVAESRGGDLGANATLFFATREFRLILSPKSTPFSRVRATPTSAKDAILPDSTSAIAFLTPSPRPPANRSFSKAKTSAKPTCNLPYHKQAG